jgi:hypothetical protein
VETLSAVLANGKGTAAHVDIGDRGWRHIVDKALAEVMGADPSQAEA